MDQKELKKKFVSLHGDAKISPHGYFSPGRVNLIGEHIDYNGGFVLPCALTLGTYLFASKTTDNFIHLSSLNFDYSAKIHLSDITKKQGDEWVNYPIGVVNEFIKKGMPITGMRFLFAGNIPDGAGLSSSASIEMGTAFAVNDLFDSRIDIIELVKMAQKAENNFVGVKCGIMDQFIVGTGKKDHALFLNCDDLTYDHIPIHLESYKIVISNTNKKRELADSKYNERYNECRKALDIVNQHRRVGHLCSLTLDDFSKIQNSFPDHTLYKRARHAITENQRVKEGARALKNGELKTFGILMNQSHDSLRDDYEVTGVHLDTLVEEARKIPGVLGARMTGAGFGGCSINLVHKESIELFCEKVGHSYKKKTGIKADFYVVDIGNGVKHLS